MNAPVQNTPIYQALAQAFAAEGVDHQFILITDLAAIAKGFGLRGTNVTDLSQLEPLFEAYRAQDTAEIWNIHVSDKVVNPTMNRQVRRGHGRM